MKNTKIISIAIAVVVILLLGGGFFLLSSHKSQQQSPQTTGENQTDSVLTLTPQQLGLTVSARDDKHAVKFTISNPKGIQSVDYELTYTTGSGEQRGVIGTADIKSSNATIESKYLDLGSCSSGTCKYDAGVTAVKLTLKITKSDGNTYKAEDTLSL